MGVWLAGAAVNWAREPWESRVSGGKGDNSVPHGTVCMPGDTSAETTARGEKRRLGDHAEEADAESELEIWWL